ncbi:MAG: 50S ribosomal protein L34 [Candidatus Zambryskibacteria bacterium RIFCSPHIGHO2_12_FULL_48_10]|nr:MAG: 50S ribosomal protein L34 [Candidatus Zambryskibacteria bacterium RIFCSPHIGHO2_12_FULL_48_10]OHB06581.1 MAG: 50S ribosomal protein L34 [Candidatus Zambryskibacteria bacterium RIFCSPLOWO2_01_FULL_48_25]
MSRTYNPKKRKRAKAHGFLSRSKTSTGKRTIRNRRRKGRARLAV